MFSFNKTILCVEFSKTSVFCALAQISGRKVDIIAIDTIQIESGILEEGVIYDAPHLQQILKNLVTSVSKNQTKIDSAWIAIPDNKVLITKFEVEKDKKGINEYELHKAIEEKFNFSASKLYLINRPIHEINRKVFFLTNAIRIDNLQPFIELFAPLNIPVESAFSTFQSIYEDLKDQFQQPTLFLYPCEKGFKFFLADQNGVHLESVWGHNVIEFNENFDKAIDEIVQYAKQSKETALGVKRIIVLESSLYDVDMLQVYLQRTGIEFNWIPNTNRDENGFDSVSISILKGLIKATMAPEFSKGFLEPQLTHLEDTKAHPPVVTKLQNGSNDQVVQPTSPYSAYAVATTKNTVVKNASNLENSWNWKIILSSVLLAVALIGLLGYVGKRISDNVSKKENITAQNNPTPSITDTPTPTLTPTDTPITTPEETPPEPTVTTLPPHDKKEIWILVHNGNNVAGEAKRVSGILQSNGFTTRAPANSPTRNIQTTTVSYKDARSQALAEEIVKLLEPSYPSAKASLDPNAREDIYVLLGAK